MTRPVVSGGVVAMGAICSSSSGMTSSKKKKASRASLTSSSDIALEVARSRSSQHRPSAGWGEGASGGGGGGSGGPGPRSSPGTPVVGSRVLPGSGQGPGSSRITAEEVMRPVCVVPTQLSGMPAEIQNLLMGRWPVPPKPGSRVISLFVAAEDVDSRAERTWLMKEVFPGLRMHTERLGFHLNIVDTHTLTATPCVPLPYLRDISRRAMASNIDLWLVILNEKLGWRLPTTMDAEDFTALHKRLAEDPDTDAIMNRVYRLDENNVPPVYRLRPPSAEDRSVGTSGGERDGDGHGEAVNGRQELYDKLCRVVTEEQDQRYMTEGFHEEVATALEHHSSVTDNVLIVRRFLRHPALPAAHRYRDLHSDGETQQSLAGKLRVLVARAECLVNAECLLRWQTTLEDVQASEEGHESAQVRELCKRVRVKLEAAVSRVVERHTSLDPYLAAGVPTVLCQELLMHAHLQQQLLNDIPVAPAIVTAVLSRIEESPTTPLIVCGPLGSGLKTLAAHVAREECRRDSARMVALRYMALTPESHSLLGALFTLLEQVATVFSGAPGAAFRGLQGLTYADFLSRLASCTEDEDSAVTVVLCGLEASMLTSADNVDWLLHSLPPRVRLVVTTCCPTLRQQMSRSQIPMLVIPTLAGEQMQSIFLNRLSEDHRSLTPHQQKAALAALARAPAPVPLLAVLLASLAMEWTSDTAVSEEHVPNTVEAATMQLLLQAEKAVGRASVKSVLSYFSVARSGLADSELGDLLALDNDLMANLYAPHTPQVRHVPQSVWLYLKHKFAPLMTKAYVYGHCVRHWQWTVTGTTVLQHYDVNVGELHSRLAALMRGCWANQLKPFAPDPAQPQVRVAVPCAVMEQPDSYDSHINCRKFLCLLHHALQAQEHADRIVAAKHHLLNPRWLVTKVDATSLVQLLDALQMAITTMPPSDTVLPELAWLQLLVARHAAAVSISGRQLHTHVFEDLFHWNSAEAVWVKNGSKQGATGQLGQKMLTGRIPFFLLLDPGPRSLSSAPSTGQIDLSTDGVGIDKSVQDSSCSPSTPLCMNGFFCRETDGRQVVSVSTGAGEIVVWDTVTHAPVSVLRGVDRPSDLVFLNEQQVLVLCDRQLKSFDLHSGALVSNIRGMLNLKMPYFRVRDADTVIVLARNRMSVNVLDVASGTIHATFKAGEDRFLDSLLVSGNGRVLVCGDETQKPFPLLVWELDHAKLLHDLRMPQHEFVTSIAGITFDGHYVACACRGLYALSTNFVVVYDLSSGQLYRQFRMAASVTALAVASDSCIVVIALNDGSLAAFDIQSGNNRFHEDGVKAIYNKMQLSTDEKLAVSYSVKAGSLPIACTVAMWDISAGNFLASYTFDSPVTCCQHVAHNNTVLVGLKSCRHYLVLSLYDSEGSEGRKKSEPPMWQLI